MSTFKCPVCSRIHVCNKYDMDYVCDNSLSEKKTSQNVRNDDNLTRNNWNFNEWDTKEDRYDDHTIVDIPKMPSDKNKYTGGTKSHNY